MAEKLRQLVLGLLKLLMFAVLAIDGFLLFIAKGGSIRSWKGGDGVVNAALIAIGLLALYILFRPSRSPRQAYSPAVQPQPQPAPLPQRPSPQPMPRPEDYKTGVIVLTEATSQDNIQRQVAGWAASRPMDSAVAVATCDNLGRVVVQLFETAGTRQLLWSGEVGELAASELPDAPYGSVAFARQVEPQVKAMVARVFE
jgi:hypothetical protein